MANGRNTALAQAFFSFIYRRVINYICAHPEFDGAKLRTKIRAVFGASLSAEKLDYIIGLARKRCPK